MSGNARTQFRQGDVVSKRYELDAALGSGPTGETWSARTLANGKRVAIKFLVPPVAEPAVIAATVAAVQKVKHDGVAALVDHGEHEGRVFLVHELVEGRSLRALMDEHAGQRKPFSLADSCQVVARVLEAMEAIHDAGLVHRHVKPSAVIVQSRQVGPGKMMWSVKLTGLGASELVAPAALAENLAERPDARYGAPELTSPGAGGTPRADVYSAGVILYEMLCGQTPMGTYLPPTSVRDDLPKHIDDIVDIGIAANAEDRYPSARDMYNDLQRAFTDVDKVPLPAMSRKQILVVLVGAVAVIAVAAVALWAANPEKAERRADASLRARVIKANPVPPEAEIQKKLVGHPNMQYIPAGTFLRGRYGSEDGKVALATEPLAAEVKAEAFYMDLFEWDNQKGGKAVLGTTAAEAEGACASVGKRLCTAVEWERACKGPEQLIYSYGDTFNAETCGSDLVGDADRNARADRGSGDLAGCQSGWHVFDLSGGAPEWTSTAATNARFRVIKGGKAGQAASATRCAWQEDRNPGNNAGKMSFRCCMSDDGSLPVDPSAAPPAPPADAAPPVEGAPVEGAPTAPTP